jgi:hypothetical protein
LGATVYLYNETRLGKREVVGPLEIWGIHTGQALVTNLRNPPVTYRGGPRELKETPQVDRIIVENVSDTQLFLPEGWFVNSENLLQSRVLVDDLLIEADTEGFARTACIESARWRINQNADFTSGRVPPSVIRAIRSIPSTSIRAEDIRQRQQNVWDSVTKHTRYGSSSSSESLIEILQSESSRPGRQELIEEVTELAEETSDGRNGVLICLAGEPLILEIFQTPELLSNNYVDLMRSIVFDATFAEKPDTSEGTLDAFLREILNSELKHRPSSRSTYFLESASRNLSSRLMCDVISRGPLHALTLNMNHPVLV